MFQIVVLGEELGLYLDCFDWNIFDWEKGFCCCFFWVFFMQDKWGSFIYGCLFYILFLCWQFFDIILDDFFEFVVDDENKEGSSEVEKG